MSLKYTWVLLFVSFTALSQNITGKLIDKNTKKPIPFATIKTGANSGLISNEEGFFTIHSKNDNETLIISCMGYQNKTLSIQHLKNLKYKVELAEAINKLSEVYISNKSPNADSIVLKIKRNLTINYTNELNKYSIFRRTTDHANFKNLEFEIEKASHVNKRNLQLANENLKTLSKKIRESKIVNFRDFKGDFYALEKDSSKLVVYKATELLDSNNDFSIEQVQEKSQKIILKYLDTTKTYKLKSGLFKIEDSLSLKDENSEEKNKHEYNGNSLNNETQSFLKHAQFHENSFLNKILNLDQYEFTYDDIIYNNNVLTHIISFKPRKGKAKYTGQIFVTDDTYAITRIDYKFYKNRHGEKINLKLILGIKYIENLSTGTLLFQKDSSDIYHPKYLKRTTGRYFYINRDVKFIENSKAKNKVSFSFKIEGYNRNKEELLFTANNAITLSDFEIIIQEEKIQYSQLNKFEKTIWDNENIIEPSLEMKAFEVE